MLEEIEQASGHLPHAQLQSHNLILLLQYATLNLLDLVPALAVSDLAFAVVLHAGELGVLECDEVGHLVQLLVDEHLLVQLEVFPVYLFADGPGLLSLSDVCDYLCDFPLHLLDLFLHGLLLLHQLVQLAVVALRFVVL